VIAVFAIALVVASGIGVTRAARERETFGVFAHRGGIQQGGPTVSPRADLIANDRGYLALLPPAPLSALAIGQGDVYPNYIKVTARSLDALVSGDQIEHPLAVASGQFDAAFVVLFLYPLLIFAVSFDLTATERDRGTLRMVLAQPVTLGEVVAGKMIVRVLKLLIPMLLIIVGTAALFSPTGAGFWPRAMLWVAAIVVYGAVWHGIALVVNARGFSAPANALILAGIWLLFAVVGPSCVNLLIAIRYPMPSRVEAAVQARAATQDATVQGSRQLGQFLQDHPTSGNVGRDGMRQFAMLQAERDRKVAERLQAVEATFNAQLEKQRRLASWLSVLSPTMIAQASAQRAPYTSCNDPDFTMGVADTATAGLTCAAAATERYPSRASNYARARINPRLSFVAHYQPFGSDAAVEDPLPVAGP
jgi:ABC-type transport system involved in multi-copper enzyme maturation permease subunit